MLRALSIVAVLSLSLTACGGTAQSVLPRNGEPQAARPPAAAGAPNLAALNRLAVSLQAETRQKYSTPVEDGWRIDTATGSFYLPREIRIRLVGKYDIGIFQFRSGKAYVSVRTADMRGIFRVQGGTLRSLGPLTKFAEIRHAAAIRSAKSHGRKTSMFIEGTCGGAFGIGFIDVSGLCICPDGSVALDGLCMPTEDEDPPEPLITPDCELDPLLCMGILPVNLVIPGSKSITYREYFFCRLLGDVYIYHTVLQKYRDGTSDCLVDDSNSNGEYPLWYGFKFCPQYTTLVQYGQGWLLDSNNYNNRLQGPFTWDEDTGGCNVISGYFL
jgi:hypothetical protein